MFNQLLRIVAKIMSTNRELDDRISRLASLVDRLAEVCGLNVRGGSHGALLLGEIRGELKRLQSEPAAPQASSEPPPV